MEIVFVQVLAIIGALTVVRYFIKLLAYLDTQARK